MDPKFEKTYRSYYPKLFRIAAKMLQDPEGAKDVVQDVFTAYYFAMNNEKVIRDTKNWLVRSTLYSEGYSYKEIAEMTGRNLPSIGKTLSRIMDKIKKHLL